MIPSHREPTHPGEVLLEEFLRPFGLTQVAAADRMGIPLNRLNEIIRGKRGVTADSAIRLAKLFGTTPEFWMNLQSNWDIYHAAKSMHIDLTRVRASIKQSEIIYSAAGEEGTVELRTHAWSKSIVAERVEAKPVDATNRELIGCDQEMVVA